VTTQSGRGRRTCDVYVMLPAPAEWYWFHRMSSWACTAASSAAAAAAAADDDDDDGSGGDCGGLSPSLAICLSHC